jgi:hypothetical protein
MMLESKGKGRAHTQRGNRSLRPAECLQTLANGQAASFQKGFCPGIWQIDRIPLKALI